MPRIVTVAVSQLNQWALDLENNSSRIIESIVLAKNAGATLRVGSELEVTGYGCLDHFLEHDLYEQCWMMLIKILTTKACDDILFSVGMPVNHRSHRYNCTIFCLNGKILLIRPKTILANDGNYCEMRYFVSWAKSSHVDMFLLPPIVAKALGILEVPFGDALLETFDSLIGCEMCEELFSVLPPCLTMALNGVEIFVNSSGSHFAAGKSYNRASLILDTTTKCGGAYLYANQIGCDGDKLFYDGCSMISLNGKILAKASQFGKQDVEVITATFDLDEVKAYRSAASFNHQVMNLRNPVVRASYNLSEQKYLVSVTSTLPFSRQNPYEEIVYGSASWLWDYLRKSGATGFLLPLSGGLDSCAVAAIVYAMCETLRDGLINNVPTIVEGVQCILKSNYNVSDPPKASEICHAILHTLFMEVKETSSLAAKQRAKQISAAFGSYHVETDISGVFSAQKQLLQDSTGFKARFRVFGGSFTENIALQNIQARDRMATAYFFAQMLPYIRNKESNSRSLLVLGSANADECLRGYLTKYDCSSADLNPIGSLSKADVRAVVCWIRDNFSLPSVNYVLQAQPSAELEPMTENYTQSDESDMCISYEDISNLGFMRKVLRLGPYSIFEKLCSESAELNGELLDKISEKVEKFHHFYSINRHKVTTLTPAFHATFYSPNENRYDMRPLLYPKFSDSLPARLIKESVKRFKDNISTTKLYK